MLDNIQESFSGYPLRDNPFNQLKHLVLKPTFKCNMFCSYCCERRQLHNILCRAKQLSLNDYFSIILDSRKLGFNGITLSGAEPTLYKQFPELCSYIKTMNWEDSYIMTNGSTLNSRISNIINSTFNYIEISFGDFSTTTFNNNRGIKSGVMYRNIYKNILEYKKIKKNFMINCIVLTRECFINLDKILQISKICGFDDINLQILEGNFNNSKLYITLDDLLYFREHVYKKILTLTPKYKKYIDSVLYVIECGVEKKVYRKRECNIPGNLIIILANGDVHPCNMIEYTHNFDVYNLHNMSLDDILNSEKYIDFKTSKSTYCMQCPMGLH